MSHRALVLLLFLCVSVPGILGIRNPKVTDAYIQEWDLIERVSAGVWFIATSWCVVAAFQARNYKKEWATGSILFFLLGFRELDGHIWLTGWNLDKLVLYWKPSIPFHERFFILCLGLTLLCWVFFVFPPRKWKALWLTYRTNAQWSSDVLLWILLLGTAMMLDKSVYLPMFHQPSSPYLDVMRGILEESLELTLGFYTLFLLFPLWVQALLFSNRPIVHNPSSKTDCAGL